MALPSAALSITDDTQQYGVLLGIQIEDASFPTEIERAPDDGTGAPDTGSTEIVGRAGAGETRILDASLPSTDDPYHYRGRHVRDGYQDGAWTEWRAAKPVRLLGLPGDKSTPDLYELDVYINEADGTLDLYAWSHPGVKSVRFDVDIDPSPEDFPTPGNGAAISSSVNTDAAGDAELLDQLSGTLNPGEEVWVRATFYASTGGSGNQLRSLRIRQRYTKVGTNQITPGSITEDLLATEAVVKEKIKQGTITADRLTVQARSFNTDVAFTATSSQRVDWSSGTVELADGTTYSISSGAVVGVTAGSLEWIYLDPSVSTTTLQSTSTYSNAVGDSKILLATAVGTASGNLTVIPAVGLLNLNGTHISPLSVSTNELQANSVVSSKIASGQVDTIHLAANSVDANVIQSGVISTTHLATTTLSGLHADLGTITAGRIDNASTNPTAGIRVSSGYSLPASYVRYIDLAATGTAAFIEHPNFALYADGDAEFGGTVTADTFTAADVTFDGIITFHDNAGAGDLWYFFSTGAFYIRRGGSTGDQMAFRIESDGDCTIEATDRSLHLSANLYVNAWPGQSIISLTDPPLQVREPPGTASEHTSGVFMLFRTSGGTLTFKRVLAGASDSAGTGYRALRIFN